jgi:hypothetical protein
MKKKLLFNIFVLSVFCFPLNTLAETSTSDSSVVWSVGVSTLQWNENITLNQTGTNERTTANYSGLGLNFEREILFPTWGWVLAGFLGKGQANAGGATTVPYQIDRQNFTIIGFNPGLFHRLTEQVQLGISALIYNRSIDLSSGSAVTVSPARDLTSTALLNIKLNLSETFEFQQNIGPLDTGATFWSIGLNYKF